MAGSPDTNTLERTSGRDEEVARYRWLHSLAEQCQGLDRRSRADLVRGAVGEEIGSEVADHVCQNGEAGFARALDALDPLDAYSARYIAGLLAEGSGQSASADHRFDGYSPPIEAIRSEIGNIIRWRLPVMLVGERGTGKGQLVRAISNQMAGKKPTGTTGFEPLTVVFAAMSPALADSELFGHEKGAFTGADKTTDGLVTVAHREKRPLFLDDVGECPLEVQSKLLTVLDDGVYHRVGSTRMLSIGRGGDRRFQVLSASQPQGIAKLRSDLRDRRAVRVIRIPPLRERGLDVLLLADFVAWSSPLLMEPPRKRLSPGAWAELLEYDWPGNVRQLFSIVTRAVITVGEGEDTIGASVVRRCLNDEAGLVEALDPSASRRVRRAPSRRRASSRASPQGSPRASPRPPDDDDDDPFPTLKQVEARHIEKAVRRSGGNVSKAAALLGIHRTTLHRKLSGLRSTADG